jgi:soluble P-type ATPase
MEITIPGKGSYSIEHLVLDVNGTVAAGGELIQGVKEALASLRESGLGIHLITADTRGRQAALDEALGWPAVRIGANKVDGEAQEKAAFVRDLGANQVAAIGNGANDAAMLREAALGIAVLGPEGLATGTLFAADVVAPDILAALEMLEDPTRLVATLRT